KLSMKRIIGCNTSFWRSDALLVNGYDEDMVGWGRRTRNFLHVLCTTGSSTGGSGFLRGSIIWIILT
ncbi:MAG: galactosyltransferase-related protein, partial [Candidatus Hydrogenedentota bacterium]